MVLLLLSGISFLIYSVNRRTEAVTAAGGMMFGFGSIVIGSLLILIDSFVIIKSGQVGVKILFGNVTQPIMTAVFNGGAVHSKKRDEFSEKIWQRSGTVDASA